jgi:hypothetical protein
MPITTLIGPEDIEYILTTIDSLRKYFNPTDTMTEDQRKFLAKINIAAFIIFNSAMAVSKDPIEFLDKEITPGLKAFFKSIQVLNQDSIRN